MGLSLGKALWELDAMPAEEFDVWCKYHATEGLPNLQMLFAHVAWVTAACHGDPKKPPKFEDFLLRPAVALTPEEAVNRLIEQAGGRVVDKR